MVIFTLKGFAQQKTVSEDKDWGNQQASLQQTSEAAFIIRIGDIDNLGFGWPDGFDPFCGRMTDSHGYPWEANAKDLPGFDRILLSSRFNPENPKGCGGDGYSAAFNPVTSKPVTYTIPTTLLKGVNINNAYLQIFIDDFQSPSLCSKFQVTLNNTRFAECEKIINAIDQTGPVGKLITIPIPEEFYQAITTTGTLSLKIDEVLGAADGFAIDFIRLLVNRIRENTCKGNIKGRVMEKNTEQAIAGARVFLADKTSTETDGEGYFSFRNIPTGFEVLTASSKGYNDGTGTADIGMGDENPDVMIYLEKGKQVIFDKKSINIGESVNLNNILFDQGKSIIKNESKSELDKVVVFLQENSTAEIELSGHTSAEGEAALNRSLSYKRVKACKDYIIGRGIDPGRIIAMGYGPDRPVAPNDTETNRAKNRRVEMRVVKL
jgi:OOP family OmpA-OmpF porin